MKNKATRKQWIAMARMFGVHPRCYWPTWLIKRRATRVVIQHAFAVQARARAVGMLEWLMFESSQTAPEELNERDSKFLN